MILVDETEWLSVLPEGGNHSSYSWPFVTCKSSDVDLKVLGLPAHDLVSEFKSRIVLTVYMSKNMLKIRG